MLNSNKPIACYDLVLIGWPMSIRLINAENRDNSETNRTQATDS